MTTQLAIRIITIHVSGFLLHLTKHVHVSILHFGLKTPKRATTIYASYINHTLSKGNCCTTFCSLQNKLDAASLILECWAPPHGSATQTNTSCDKMITSLRKAEWCDQITNCRLSKQLLSMWHSHNWSKILCCICSDNLVYYKQLMVTNKLLVRFCAFIPTDLLDVWSSYIHICFVIVLKVIPWWIPRSTKYHSWHPPILFAAAPTPTTTVAALPVIWPGSWSWAGLGPSPEWETVIVVIFEKDACQLLQKISSRLNASSVKTIPVGSATITCSKWKHS